MSPVALDHEENDAKCHHCHITSPIPLGELIKTHPLRSSVAKVGFEVGQNGIGDADKSAESEKKGSLIEALLEEVANHEFKLKKKIDSSSTSEESSSNNSLDRDKPPSIVRPVHSYLHHISDKSIYKKPYIPLAPKPEESLDKITSYTKLGSSAHLKSETVGARSLTPREDKQLGSQTKQANAKSPDLILSTKSFSFPTDVSVNKSKHLRSSLRDDILQNNSKDIETQTSQNNSVSRATLTRVRDCLSDVSSSVSDRRCRRKRNKKCGLFLCTLPSGLLFAGYGLLIVIGIVVAVALSQRERRISLQASPVPRRPFTFPGAQPAPIPGPGRGPQLRVPQPTVRIASGVKRRPVVKPFPRQNVIAVPRPAPAPVQTKAPVQAPTNAVPIFRDEDFDYLQDVGFNDADFLLPLATPPAKQAPKQTPQPTQPRQQAFRPVEIIPQFRAQAPAPAQNVRAVAKAPANKQAAAPRRQGTPNTFRQEFNIQPQPQEDANRGQKEPAVKIIKSWSNRNADGTFSWGYINTDGSFKNETKGTDCVVRGVYGYVDEATGETRSFPYESGNPCDPNAPDYYYDYEEGAIVSQGQVVQRPRKVVQNVPRRNQ